MPANCGLHSKLFKQELMAQCHLLYDIFIMASCFIIHDPSSICEFKLTIFNEPTYSRLHIFILFFPPAPEITDLYISELLGRILNQLLHNRIQNVNDSNLHNPIISATVILIYCFQPAWILQIVPRLHHEYGQSSGQSLSRHQLRATCVDLLLALDQGRALVKHLGVGFERTFILL